MKKWFYFDMIELVISLIAMLIFSLLFALMYFLPIKLFFLICAIYMALNTAKMWEKITTYKKSIVTKNNNQIIYRKNIKKIKISF